MRPVVVHRLRRALRPSHQRLAPDRSLEVSQTWLLRRRSQRSVVHLSISPFQSHVITSAYFGWMGGGNDYRETGNKASGSLVTEGIGTGDVTDPKIVVYNTIPVLMTKTRGSQ